MSDLLKEAIADAKAVRETALQNAKMALQEAFTPQLKSMLSAKLREDEDEFEDDEMMGGEEEAPMMAQDEDPGEEEVPMDMGDEESMETAMYDQDEVPGDEFGGEEEVPGEEEVIEINGVKYAPVVSEEDEMFEADTHPGEQPEPDGYGPEVHEDLELEAIIKELEDEEELEEQDDAYDEKVPPKNGQSLAEEDDAYPEDVENKSDPNHVKKLGEETIYEIADSLFEEEDEDDEKVEETINFNGKTYRMVEQEDDDEDLEDQTTSSGIGNGTGVTKASAADEEDPGKEKLYKELKEHRQAVKFLKDKLHEVNILNAKLLFTNKIFKEFALSNDQKMNVVENFDRAHTTREIKLVYATLCEGFGQNKGIRKKSINEVASAKAGSTRPSKKVITESDAIAERFKKLANIR